MCGIAGFVSMHPLGPDSSELGDRLLRNMVHRGPDGAGIFSGDHVWLGMRRLSIIDPEGGWQPLYNEDRSLVLIANGEIYNYVELRQSLVSRGHTFRTGSDCETIVHLYEEHGEHCVDHLRGMFAFALWDKARGSLLLARDRMGEKPLYLFERDRRLFFSSELRPLIATGVVPFAINAASVDLHLHYGYVPEPQTMVRDLAKLPAGCTLTIETSEWRKEVKRYWSMIDTPVLRGDPAEAVEAQLQDIGRLIIRSDVPVGVALSGGLDSSLVAALAAKYSPQTLHTFTVGYEGSVESDERVAAKRFAEYLGMPWHEVVLSTSEVIEGFPSLVERTDDPIADIAGYGYYAVMRAAREHGIPVMIQGQGGDELFWGYDWVREAAARSHRKALARKNGRKAFAEYWRAELPPTNSLRDLRRWCKKFCGVYPALAKLSHDRRCPPDELVFYNLNNEFAAADRMARSLYAKDYTSSLEPRQAHALFDSADYWQDVDTSLTSLICSTYLIENGLAQGDRLSMASSVELRLPLVDYRLVETVIGLRKAQADHAAPLKNVLRKVAVGLLPEWVMNRKKRGFSPPVDQWLNGIHGRYGCDLDDGLLVGFGFLDKRTMSRLAKNPPLRGPERNVWFSLVVLETWCRAMNKLAPGTR
jgi:asparagine synthase (glutamine-hydrolysing)